MTGEEINSLILQCAILWPCALLAIGIAGKRGCFETKRLLEGPDRTYEVRPLPLAIGLLALLFGVILAGMALLYLGITGDKPEDPALLAEYFAKQALTGQLVGQALPVVLFLWVLGQKAGALRAFGITLISPGLVATGVRCFLFALPVTMAVSSLFMLLSKALGIEAPAIGHELLQAMRDSPPALARMGLVVSAMFLAPLLEEIMFRGVLQTLVAHAFGPRKRWLTIAVASLLFALVHLSAATWQVLPALFVLGVIFGWIYERTGSLWPSIVAHCGFNAANIVMAMLLETPA